MSELLEHHHAPHVKPKRPAEWHAFHRNIRHRWAMPFLCLDWLSQWAAYGLSRISFFELLEYCGSLSILIAVVFYFVEAPERTKLKHYQAWQVINTAQGKGGSGGRIDALHELNEDKVPLVGVDLSDSFLQGLVLEHADLRRSTFHGADLKGANLEESKIDQGGFASANLRDINLTGADLTEANFADADLVNSNLSRADLRGAKFDRADLRGADLTGVVNWKDGASFRLANIHGVRNAPGDYILWAMRNGAVDLATDHEWEARLAKESMASFSASNETPAR